MHPLLVSPCSRRCSFFYEGLRAWFAIFLVDKELAWLCFLFLSSWAAGSAHGVPGVRGRQAVGPFRVPPTIQVPRQVLDAVRLRPPVSGTLFIPTPSEEGTTSSSSGSTTGAAGPPFPGQPPGPYLTTFEAGSSGSAAFGLLTLRPLDGSDSGSSSGTNKTTWS